MKEEEKRGKEKERKVSAEEWVTGHQIALFFCPPLIYSVLTFQLNYLPNAPLGRGGGAVRW